MGRVARLDRKVRHAYRRSHHGFSRSPASIQPGLPQIDERRQYRRRRVLPESDQPEPGVCDGLCEARCHRFQSLGAESRHRKYEASVRASSKSERALKILHRLALPHVRHRQRREGTADFRAVAQAYLATSLQSSIWENCTRTSGNTKGIGEARESLRLEPDSGLNYATLAYRYLMLDRVSDVKTAIEEAEAKNLETTALDLEPLSAGIFAERRGRVSQTGCLGGSQAGRRGQVFRFRSCFRCVFWSPERFSRAIAPGRILCRASRRKRDCDRL